MYYELTPDTECLAAHAHQEVPVTDGEGQREWGHATEEPVDVVVYDENPDAPAANVPDAEGADLVAIEH